MHRSKQNSSLGGGFPMELKEHYQKPNWIGMGGEFHYQQPPYGGFEGGGVSRLEIGGLALGMPPVRPRYDAYNNGFPYDRGCRMSNPPMMPIWRPDTEPVMRQVQPRLEHNPYMNSINNMYRFHPFNNMHVEQNPPEMVRIHHQQPLLRPPLRKKPISKDLENLDVRKFLSTWDDKDDDEVPPEVSPIPLDCSLRHEAYLANQDKRPFQYHCDIQSSRYKLEAPIEMDKNLNILPQERRIERISNCETLHKQPRQLLCVPPGCFPEVQPQSWQTFPKYGFLLDLTSGQSLEKKKEEAPCSFPLPPTKSEGFQDSSLVVNVVSEEAKLEGSESIVRTDDIQITLANQSDSIQGQTNLLESCPSKDGQEVKKEETLATIVPQNQTLDERPKSVAKMRNTLKIRKPVRNYLVQKILRKYKKVKSYRLLKPLRNHKLLIVRRGALYYNFELPVCGRSYITFPDPPKMFGVKNNSESQTPIERTKDKTDLKCRLRWDPEKSHEDQEKTDNDQHNLNQVRGVWKVVNPSVPRDDSNQEPIPKVIIKKTGVDGYASFLSNETTIVSGLHDC